MYQLFLIIHIVIAISIVGLVLLQQGKGAEMGAAFGSGASNTVFGSQGTGGFLFKLTAGLVIAFFTTSVSLSSIVANQYQHSMNLPATETQKVEPNTLPIPMPND